MAVPCPGCGREYDVALFQFGRTLHCTCGARVGLEARRRPLGGGSAPRFAADAMLGRLARWLRIAGCDVLYQPDVEDGALVRWALDEDRVLLTRDRALPVEWRAPRVLVLESEAPLEQLREVAAACAIDWRARLFTRCSRCNAALAPAAREDVAGRVPERVHREQRRFLRCPGCERVYWEGSHVARMRRVLEATLGA